jgi:RNA polymerase sigma-70 factor (ECF subfamily)
MVTRMDDALVARARGGDRAAMEGVLASVAPSIRRFAARMCRNDADADDVLQDALLSIATQLDSFEGRSSLPSWAFTIARTACSRRRRGKKNQAADGADVLGTRAADEPGPEDHASSLETSAIVARALERLPEDYREVLLLRDAEGLTAPEAAGILGVSVDALKSRLHRARAALRDELRPVLEGPAAALPPSPDCPDVIRALSRKLEDELDADACAQMEKHVASCASCARACDAMKDALRACRSSTAAELTPAIQERIRSAITRWLRERG